MIRKSKGFTLLELLVVITIIVVLLALLAPALDKAIYEAEMAVDGAHIKTIAQGAALYAVGASRRYPDHARSMKPDAISTPGSSTALFLAATGGGSHVPVLGVADAEQQRKLFASFLPLDILNDPFQHAPADFVNTEPDSWLNTGYDMWFGYRLSSGKAMARLGDRWTFDGTAYDVMVGDRYHARSNGAVHYGSHQDDQRIMAPDAYADNLPGVHTTFSRWLTNSAGVGRVDLQFAYADSSVVRINGVPNALEWTESTWGEVDRVEAFIAEPGNLYYTHVPAR